MKARVHVILKEGVLDPQGKAIGNALASLGFAGVGEVRQGKLIELELAETDPLRARSGRSDVPAAARQPGDRKLRDRNHAGERTEASPARTSLSFRPSSCRR